jgi:uncharacterized membrane protein YgcG
MSRNAILQAMLERAGSAGSSVASAARDTQRALSDFSYSIRDRTSSKGFVPGMNPMFDAMRQAAANAGLSRLEMVAGKGQGHLSHAHGTEADFVGYNADGSKWTKAQRVAVAQGASTAGGNRFGFYSGPTLHVGLGYTGSPHNVVWNNQLRGQPGVTTFDPAEQGFVNALRMGKLASYKQGPINASGVSGNPQVAAQQKQLNALGAGLKEDGIMGPRTRAAMAKYSPHTSPSAQAYTSKASIQSPALQAATRQAQATAAPRIPQARPQSPYTNSTGGANAIVPRQVPTVAVQSGVRSKSPLPSYYDSQASSNMSVMGGRRVPTAAGYVPTTGPVLTGGFSPPTATPPRPAVPQTPYLNQPYTMSTGGANAIVAPTARMPQARPDYQVPTARMPQPVPQAVRAAAVAEAMRQEQMRRDAAAAAQASSRSSMGSSGYSGGGYSGGGGYVSGGYGGAGGRSISQGVGGSFRNR